MLLVADMRRLRFISLIFILGLFSGCASLAAKSDLPPGIAVWELEDITADGQLTYAGELLTAQITDILAKKGKYTVVERSRLLRILEEQHLSVSSLTDRQTQLKLGEIAGARLMVFGGYQIFGNNVRLDIRMVDVETGTITKAIKKNVASTDIQTLLDAAKAMAEEL
jgi:curli biogenesis system outer membrane secretion channel CsgG